jgi:zinc-ribbon domain
MNLICNNCGTELLAGMSFCRQCGTAIVSESIPDSSEQPTTLFSETNTVATQRLDPRPTSEPQPSAHGAAAIGDRPGRKRWKPLLALGVVGLVIVTLVAVVAINRIHSRKSADALLYPGAQTVVDIMNQDGGRSLHLQTTDSFKKVEDWYERSLKPQKIVRLTSTNVVLKNETTTVTIASEGGITNILVKVIDSR